MKKRSVFMIDAETGEVLPNLPLYIPTKYQNGFISGWIAMAQGEPLKILATSNLQGQDLKVFLLLLNKVNFDNWIQVNQAELARDLNMQRQNVNIAIKKLISMQVLIEGPKIGICRTYRLNPNFGWKGSAKGHVIELNDKRKGPLTP
jgi:hypothetical protein